jgi:hypothetical protein
MGPYNHFANDFVLAASEDGALAEPHFTELLDKSLSSVKLPNGMDKDAIDLFKAATLDKNTKDFAGKWVDPSNYEDQPDEESISLEPIPYVIFICKEAGGTAKGAYTLNFTLGPEGKVSKLFYTPDMVKGCKTFGLEPGASSTFLAKDFPIKPFTSYIQGSADLRAPPIAALTHFRTVPQGGAQFIMVKNMGHIPAPTMYRELKSEGRLQADCFLKIYHKMLDGDPVKQSDITNCSQTGPFELDVVNRMNP